MKVADLPGYGAAGGLAAGLVGVLNARMRHGVDVVAHAIGLERKLAGCDLVIPAKTAIHKLTALTAEHFMGLWGG